MRSAPHDRRTFLLRVGAAGVLAPFSGLAALGACAPPDRGRNTSGAREADGGATVPDLSPATVRDLGNGAVGLHVGGGGPAVAYVSRRDRRVYLDPAWRARAHFLLGAYTSVSTGLWRIPLPGDDPRAPIVPGDELREFEATDLAAWDPEREAVPGDIRVRAGAARDVTVELPCRLPASGAWAVRGGPWELTRLDGPAGRGGREAFVAVGSARRHATAACAGPGVEVEVLAWVAATPG